jgi:hypothetical protein
VTTKVECNVGLEFVSHMDLQSLDCVGLFVHHLVVKKL